MSKNLRWKIIIILAVIALLAWASYPLTESNVRDYIKREGVNQDEAFNQLLEVMGREYDIGDRKVPISGVELLKMETDKLGIDLTTYFPDQENNKEAIRYIGRETKGSLNLGLDLQGGIHVILAVDELELVKKGADNVDDQFTSLMTAAQEKASGSFQDPLDTLRAEVVARNFDLVPYYQAHYENKYGLEEGSIKTNEDVYDNFDREVQAANLGSLEILRNRVDKFGVSEPEIQKQGKNELLIQLPGVRDPEQTLDLIQGQAFLEFKLVDNDQERLEKAIKEDKAPPGFVLKNYKTTDFDGEEKSETLLLVDKSDLTGEMLVTAYFGTKGGTGEPIVHIKFDKKGERIFSGITKQYNAEDNPPGRRLAIVLDGEILSAPNIRVHIRLGEAYIEGNFDFDSAKLLSSQLSAGAYPAPLMIKEQRSVGPSLGEDSIHQGVRAALAGLIVVIIFMAIYYLLAGLVANFALCLNIGLIIGVLCLLPYLFGGFKATLTLPGIAGIILTIGMAVDANVLIFERIREELATGKKIKRAISEGYGKAFLTIIDANLTTVIAALVLLNPLGFSYLPTSGPIKGFALTLTVGICASMFSALVITRAIFELFCLSPRFTNLKMFQFFKRPNFDFIGKRWGAYLISGILIIVSIAAFVVNGEDNLGIDFSGGILIQRQFTGEVPAKKIREIMDGIGLEGVSVQHYGGGTGIIIRAGGDSTREIDDAIKAALPGMIDEEIYEQRTEMVGPKVGKMLRTQALGAVILAVLAIMAYIWFRFHEFKFALGAVLALVHDVIITIGFLTGFLLLPIREFSIPIIAALLTIVGYSLNDTIVVFVRIRENMKAMRGESDEVIINTSINQVLNRTILTSVTTLIVVIFLFIFGGPVINDFAYALMVGVVVGTYSSIFIASPVLLFWHKRRMGK
ncbi:MAG: protein translocase subunit SecD [Candidatus Auribacterota bacterium]|nr:protein translocase subunit SecD [Candidatus Auribacterota bacterium]